MLKLSIPLNNYTENQTIRAQNIAFLSTFCFGLNLQNEFLSKIEGYI